MDNEPFCLCHHGCLYTKFAKGREGEKEGENILQVWRDPQRNVLECKLQKICCLKCIFINVFHHYSRPVNKFYCVQWGNNTLETTLFAVAVSPFCSDENPYTGSLYWQNILCTTHV